MLLGSSLLALVLGAVISGTTAAPAANPRVPGTACKVIDRRKEWRDLTTEQRLGYLEAVKCLHTLPPSDPTRGATSRYEEFQATHILLTMRVHLVGHFLPWHRHLGTLYGNALREECGYDGPTAYWDWSRDADSDIDFLKSPILDPVEGFGGDGVPGTYTLPPDPNGESEIFPNFPPPTNPGGGFPPPGTTPPGGGFPPPGTTPPGGGSPPPTTGPGNSMYKGCVQDGPFAQDKWTVHLGPGRMKTAHCLVRGINPSMIRMMSSANVQRALATKSYEEFRLLIDSFQVMLHGGGHAVIGGEMTNTFSAGADPLFYMHHAMLDKVWWDWQNLNPEKRLTEVSGPSTRGGNDTITLDFEIDFPALGPNITVRDTMDTSLEPNCFVYE